MTRHISPRASLVIPTRDKMSHLKIVLEAFARQITDQVEVILIFDGCRKETLDEFQSLELSFEPQTIVCERNVGRASARNKGIEQAKGDIIIFSDDDVIPCAGFVRRHIQGHRERCVLLGEVRYLRYSDEQITLLGQRCASEIDLAKLEKDTVKKNITAIRRFYRPIWDKILKPLSFLTTNVSVARDDLIRVGMFDENFRGWGYEDIDLGYRLSAADIAFKRDPSVVNYHINHAVNHAEKAEEARATLRYFLDKIKDDQMSKIVLRSYFTIASLFGKF